jgi:hypothetical protein
MSPTPLGTKYYGFTVPGVHGVFEYRASCYYRNLSYVIGKSFHVGSIDALFTELTVTELETHLDEVLPREYVTSAWRINSGTLYNITCSGNMTGTYSVKWYADPSKYRIGSTVDINCSLLVAYPQEFTVLNSTTYVPIQTMVYQEQADVSPFACKSTGGGYGYNQPVWPNSGYLYMNYTKPMGAIGAVWQVKHGSVWASSNKTICQPPAYNVTIPSSCYNAYSDRLVLRFMSRINPAPQTSQGECYTGSSWVAIATNTETRPGGGGFSGPGALNNPQYVWDSNWGTNTVSNLYGIVGYGSVYWQELPDIYCNTGTNPNGEHLPGRVYEEAIWWNMTIPGKRIEVRDTVRVEKNLRATVAKG